MARRKSNRAGRPIESDRRADKERLNNPPGEHRRIAVKIVDDRGIESLKVVRLEE